MGDTVIWDGVNADYDYDHVDNWVLNGPPVSTDAVIFPPMAHADGTDVDGDDYDAALLASFTIMDGCYVDIGVATTGAPVYLQIDADAVTLEPAGTILLDIDNCAAISVRDCKSTSLAGTYGLYLIGTGNTILNVLSTNTGDISIAALAGETAAFTTISIAGGDVTIGSGVTMTTLNVSGGTVINSSAATTVIVYGGTYTHNGGAVGALNCIGGTTYINATETITVINVHADATIDFSKDMRTKTVSLPFNVAKGATIRDPYDVVTSMVVDCEKCGLDEITLVSAKNKRFTLGTVG